MLVTYQWRKALANAMLVFLGCFLSKIPAGDSFTWNWMELKHLLITCGTITLFAELRYIYSALQKWADGPPDGGTMKTVAMIFLTILLFAAPAFGQQIASAPANPIPVPVDVPVTHVVISASFNGYDSDGKYVTSTVDIFGVPIYRNVAATQGFDLNYEHIQVPSLGQRWELGLGCYWLSLPRIKNLLFDTSNFVATACAGAGKLLSVSDGNRMAYTISPSVTYPIAGHMAWSVSYQYLRATGGIAGVLNKSYNVVGTGPVIHF
jgi:hypothetical protein